MINPETGKFLPVGMKSTTLELFWVEKIKLTQYTWNHISHLTDQGLDYPGDLARGNIRKTLRSEFIVDRKFLFYLPISIRMSQILPFSPMGQSELERELTQVRDICNPPALPTNLSDLIVRSSDDLDFRETDPGLHVFFQDWKETLNRLEAIFTSITEEDALRLRYFSLKGIFSLPSAVNLTAMTNHHLFASGIQKILEDPDFPEKISSDSRG